VAGRRLRLLAAGGVLVLLGLAFTRHAWPRRRPTYWGFGCLAVAELGTVLVGLNPENETLRIHLLGALNIPAANTALLLLGLATLTWRRGIGLLSLVLGIVGWLGLPLGILLLVASGHGGGAAERVALYPVFIWTIVVGAAYLRVAGRPVGAAAAGDRTGRRPVRSPVS